MTKFIEVITTYETADEARKIARMIIGQRLGGCCSIVEVESIVRWDGRIDSSHEFQLTIKTAEKLYSKLESVILENHPYEVPQIISLPILSGSDGYLGWLTEETK